MIRKKRRRAAIPGHTIRLERLETRNLLAADMPMFQNPIEPMDVNDDGEITPVDALMVINRLRKEGREDGDRMFTDVNGDGILTPIDALVVINGINSGARARQHPPAPPEEQKPVVAGEIDGSNNNQEYTEWGAAHTQLLRITSVDYADGISEPAGQDRASPREISNLVARGVFKKPPIGPIGSYLSLEHMEWARALEFAIGGMYNAWIVDNSSDRRVL